MSIYEIILVLCKREKKSIKNERVQEMPYAVNNILENLKRSLLVT